MTNAIIEDYQASLDDLTFNSKPHINALTMLAEEYLPHAEHIVRLIEAQLNKALPTGKLPLMYLMDSIVKNVGGNYTPLFSKNIVKNFYSTFDTGDERTKICLHKLRSTWDNYFPLKKLYEIDVRIHAADPNWPVKPLPPNLQDKQSTSIHVNPKFLKKVEVTNAPSSDTNRVTALKPSTSRGVKDSVDLKQDLINKQKQLLDLQQQKLLLELEQTKEKLAAALGEKRTQIKNKGEGLSRDPRMKQAPAPTQASGLRVTVVNGQKSSQPVTNLPIRDPRNTVPALKTKAAARKETTNNNKSGQSKAERIAESQKKSDAAASKSATSTVGAKPAADGNIGKVVKSKKSPVNSTKVAKSTKNVSPKRVASVSRVDSKKHKLKKNTENKSTTKQITSKEVAKNEKASESTKSNHAKEISERPLKKTPEPLKKRERPTRKSPPHALAPPTKQARRSASIERRKSPLSSTIRTPDIPHQGRVDKPRHIVIRDEDRKRGRDSPRSNEGSLSPRFSPEPDENSPVKSWRPPVKRICPPVSNKPWDREEKPGPRGMPRRRSSVDPNLRIPQELTLSHQAEILKQAEIQLQTGQLTHAQHQELLKQLHQLFELQRLRNLQLMNQGMPEQGPLGHPLQDRMQNTMGQPIRHEPDHMQMNEGPQHVPVFLPPPSPPQMDAGRDQEFLPHRMQGDPRSHRIAHNQAPMQRDYMHPGDAPPRFSGPRFPYRHGGDFHESNPSQMPRNMPRGPRPVFQRRGSGDRLKMMNPNNRDPQDFSDHMPWQGNRDSGIVYVEEEEDPGLQSTDRYEGRRSGGPNFKDKKRSKSHERAEPRPNRLENTRSNVPRERERDTAPSTKDSATSARTNNHSRKEKHERHSRGAMLAHTEDRNTVSDEKEIDSKNDKKVPLRTYAHDSETDDLPDEAASRGDVGKISRRQSPPHDSRDRKSGRRQRKKSPKPEKADKTAAIDQEDNIPRLEEPEDYIIASIPPEAEVYHKHSLTLKRRQSEAERAYREHKKNILLSTYTKKLAENPEKKVEEEPSDLEPSNATASPVEPSVSSPSSRKDKGDDDITKSPSLPLKKRRYLMSASEFSTGEGKTDSSDGGVITESESEGLDVSNKKAGETKPEKQEDEKEEESVIPNLKDEDVQEEVQNKEDVIEAGDELEQKHEEASIPESSPGPVVIAEDGEPIDVSAESVDDKRKHEIGEEDRHQKEADRGRLKKDGKDVKIKSRDRFFDRGNRQQRREDPNYSHIEEERLQAIMREEEERRKWEKQLEEQLKMEMRDERRPSPQPDRGGPSHRGSWGRADDGLRMRRQERGHFARGRGGRGRGRGWHMEGEPWNEGMNGKGRFSPHGDSMDEGPPFQGRPHPDRVPPHPDHPPHHMDRVPPHPERLPLRHDGIPPRPDRIPPHHRRHPDDLMEEGPRWYGPPDRNEREHFRRIEGRGPPPPGFERPWSNREMDRPPMRDDHRGPMHGPPDDRFRPPYHNDDMMMGHGPRFPPDHGPRFDGPHPDHAPFIPARPEPAPEISQVNVNKLLSDLLNMGIIPGNKPVEGQAPGPASGKNSPVPPVLASVLQLPTPQPKQETVASDAPTQTTAAGVSMPPSMVPPAVAETSQRVPTPVFYEEDLMTLDPDANLPEITLQDMDKLKIRCDELIKRLYTGIQCSACGMRFTACQTDMYAEHLDWHYRLNRKDKDGIRDTHRKIYPTAGDWIMYEEIEDPEQRARNQVFDEANSQENEAEEPEQPVNSEDLIVPVTGRPGEDRCEVCKESFKTVYSDEDDEWQFVNCVAVDGKNFHPNCYADHNEQPGLEPLPTPIRVPLYNPMEFVAKGIPGLDSLVKEEESDEKEKMEIVSEARIPQEKLQEDDGSLEENNVELEAEQAPGRDDAGEQTEVKMPAANEEVGPTTVSKVDMENLQNQESESKTDNHDSASKPEQNQEQVITESGEDAPELGEPPCDKSTPSQEDPSPAPSGDPGKAIEEDEAHEEAAVSIAPSGKEVSEMETEEKNGDTKEDRQPGFSQYEADGVGMKIELPPEPQVQAAPHIDEFKHPFVSLPEAGDEPKNVAEPTCIPPIPVQLKEEGLVPPGTELDEGNTSYGVAEYPDENESDDSDSDLESTDV